MGKIQTRGITEKMVSSHAANDDVNDACSPFCVCACCNSTSEVLTASLIEIISQPVSPEYYSSYPGDVISLPLSVWQPPKLS